jgi:hypothetical protein
MPGSPDIVRQALMSVRGKSCLRRLRKNYSFAPRLSRHHEIPCI